MHRHLLTKAWEKGDTDVHPLRVRIRHLRQKIEARSEQDNLILTEPGGGYQFVGARG
jgi:two-component system KDP operon response regulator KdpE